MEGIEKLQAQVAEMNNYSVSRIFEYLKTRKDLYEKFNNEEKSAEGMYDYIYSKASKHKHNNMAMIDDNVVYLWTVTYFTKSNEELGIKEKKEEKVMPPSSKDVIEKIDKEQVKKEEDAKKQNQQITLFEEGAE